MLKSASTMTWPHWPSNVSMNTVNSSKISLLLTPFVFFVWMETIEYGKTNTGATTRYSGLYILKWLGFILRVFPSCLTHTHTHTHTSLLWVRVVWYKPLVFILDTNWLFFFFVLILTTNLSPRGSRDLEMRGHEILWPTYFYIISQD